MLIKSKLDVGLHSEKNCNRTLFLLPKCGSRKCPITIFFKFSSYLAYSLDQDLDLINISPISLVAVADALPICYKNKVDSYS